MSHQPVNNYAVTVNLITPHGFPLRIVINVDGYTLGATSTGRLLIRGPGTGRTAIVDSIAYTTIDILNNKYVINVPANAVDYSSILEGKPYTWSFDADETLFRIQGGFTSSNDTGQAAGDPHNVGITVGDLSISVSLPAGQQGDKGDLGPQGTPGKIQVSSRYIYDGGAVLATDELVYPLAAGADITVSLPDAADLWNGIYAATILIQREIGDSGNVKVTWNSGADSFQMIPLEGLYVTTADQGLTLSVSGAPVLITQSRENLSFTGIAGDVLSGHRILASNGTDLVYADKDDGSTIYSIAGLNISAVSNGDPVSVITGGLVEESTWPWVIGQIFLGNGGQLTQTPPTTGYLVQVAKAINATQIILKIEEPIKLI